MHKCQINIRQLYDTNHAAVCTPTMVISMCIHALHKFWSKNMYLSIYKYFKKIHL